MFVIKFLSGLIAKGGILAMLATPVWYWLTNAPSWVMPGATTDVDFRWNRSWSVDGRMPVIEGGTYIPGEGRLVEGGHTVQFRNVYFDKRLSDEKLQELTK